MEATVSIHNSLTALSGVTGRGQGGEPPPWQAKCRNWVSYR